MAGGPTLPGLLVEPLMGDILDCKTPGARMGRSGGLDQFLREFRRQAAGQIELAKSNHTPESGAEVVNFEPGKSDSTTMLDDRTIRELHL